MSGKVKIFAITPFFPTYDQVWNAMKETGGAITAKDDFFVGNVFENITDCYIAVIDVSTQNRNVIFELGHALAAKLFLIWLISKIQLRNHINPYIHNFIYK